VIPGSSFSSIGVSDGGGTSPLLQALKELAAKRSELGAAIITLARVAGVDPAPYLGVEAGEVEAPASDVPLGDRLRAAAKQMREGNKRKREPKPPRPRRPASPSTNGTGRANKVLQVLSAEPKAQKEIVKRSGLKVGIVREVLGNLVAAKRVTRTGSGRGQRFTLA
jgi:hypothetical protein